MIFGVAIAIYSIVKFAVNSFLFCSFFYLKIYFQDDLSNFDKDYIKIWNEQDPNLDTDNLIGKRQAQFVIFLHLIEAETLGPIWIIILVCY